MPGEILRRPQARLDLIDIWNYIADDNEAAADRMLDRIGGVLRMLSEQPKAGRERPELAPVLRSFRKLPVVLPASSWGHRPGKNQRPVQLISAPERVGSSAKVETRWRPLRRPTWAIAARQHGTTCHLDIISRLAYINAW
jgi:plasmid stabilization system protein ParE